MRHVLRRSTDRRLAARRLRLAATAALLVGTAVAVAPTALAAQHADHAGAAPGDAAPRLGRVTFPVSATGDAERAFLDGVLYLHSFEYDAAAAAFRRAQALAPRFAMAYWGEAMTYTHPLWNEQDSVAARAVLGRLAPTREARLAAAGTARERGYLEAVEALYGDGPKAARDTAYAHAMARLSAAHPDDDEARAFHALALLGLSQAVRDVPTYMHAAAIVAPVFAANPSHPGAAHYLIHAFDDPVHAPLGLPAARAYSTIAPDAPHAQHMTSHIFLALGMWDETVQANETAVAAIDAARGPGQGACGHYGLWLHYGYLQQGRPQAAARVMETCRATGGPRAAPSLVVMQAAQIVDDGSDAAAALPTIDATRLRPEGRALVAIAAGHAAAERGDTAALHAARTAMAAALGPDGRGWPGYGEIALRQLDALVARSAGDSARALVALRRAAAVEDSLPMDFGPPLAIRPSSELLGETLLGYGRTAEARGVLEHQLRRTPGRTATLVALARAARAAGDAARAAEVEAVLAANLRRAEPDAPRRTAVR